MFDSETVAFVSGECDASSKQQVRASSAAAALGPNQTNRNHKKTGETEKRVTYHLLQHADFVSSGCSATRRKFLSATQQK